MRPVKLIEAAYIGYVAEVRRLLDSGEYIDAQDIFGFTALHWAAQHNHLQVVTLLLERGANVDVRCFVRKTPLHYAIHYGFESIITCLLNYNANVDARDVMGLTPVSLAYSIKSKAMLNTIVARTLDVNQTCLLGMTPIEKAISQGHIYLTRLLVNHGAKVNYITALKISLLHMSCSYTSNNAEMIECVLKGGANPNELEPDGSTAFHYVLEHATLNIIQLMMNYGASLETKTLDGRTPLHSASLNKHTSVLKMLLDKGADVNARTVSGVTVLETSLYSRNLKSHEVIAYLIWKGVDYGNQMIKNMMIMPLTYWEEKERIILTRIALEDYENKLSDISKKEIADNISISQFHEKCKAELARLSEIKLNEGYTAVDILLISEHKQVLELVVGCEIKEIFDIDIFPMYHTSFTVIFPKDFENIIAKENAAWYLSQIMNLNSRKNLIVSEILSHLTADDLKHFSPKR